MLMFNETEDFGPLHDDHRNQRKAKPKQSAGSVYEA